MGLGQRASEMRRVMRRLEEAQGAARSNRTEVERLIEAMVSGPQVPARAAAVMGQDGVAAFMADLRLALFPVVVHVVQQHGGKVSGMAPAAVKTAFRGMARE